MATPPKTLTEACAPVFLYLTAFRRNSATSKIAIKELQQDLRRVIDVARGACEADARLRPLFERALYPLVATADQLVLASQWVQRAGWSMNLLETQYFKTAEGGKRFYRVVDEVLADPTDAARELGELLFTCLGLGFQGELMGERKEYERRRQLLYDKARLPTAIGDSLAPDCYGRNCVRRVALLPSTGVMRVALVAVAALVFAFGLIWVVTSSRTKYAAKITEALPE